MQHIFIKIAAILIALTGSAWAHDHTKPELDRWFNRLQSAKGLCCSNNDGTALSDVDWESRNGKYRVRINGQWIDVPDDAVVTVPNLSGRTMVWPMRGTFDSNGIMQSLYGISIRCFMPGSMS